MEVKRVTVLVMEWLTLELERKDFRVKETEKFRKIDVGGFTINARIDRVDEVEGEGLAVIDYKTGKCAKSDWVGARPREPQMLIYSSAGDFDAVAFGSLKLGGVKFEGTAKSSDMLPDVKGFEEDGKWRETMEGVNDWDDLRAKWKETLDALGRDFLAGVNDVHPNNLMTSKSACTFCSLGPFCRVMEAVVADDEE